MAKRFIETTLWDDPWFRKLPPHYKLFWIFIWNRSDAAGVWKLDLEAAEFFIGAKIDTVKALELFNDAKCRVAPINGSGKWLVVQFIDFQYGTLSKDCIPHRKVFELLSLHKLKIPFDYPNPYPSDRVQDKEKDKEEKKEVFTAAAEFDKVWAKYPKRLSRKDALRHFKASVKNEDDLKMLYVALDNFLAHAKTIDPQYIPHGGTWFNNWQDWIEYKAPVRYQQFARRFPEDKRINTEGRGGAPVRVGELSMLEQIEKWKQEAANKGGIFKGTQKQESAK